MKEEWLFPGAVIPVDVETTAALVAEIKRLIEVDVETTAALVAEIKRLIDVVGGMALAQPEQEPVQSNCKHEWADDTKDKPAWRCIKCGSDYTRRRTHD